MSTSPRQSAGPVVVGVAGGEISSGALRYAVREAVRRNVTLRLVHVMPLVPMAPLTPLAHATPMSGSGSDTLSEMRAVAMKILTRARETATELAPGLRVETELGHGSTSLGIVKAATDAQLVVVGRETRHGVDRLLAGATTAGVAGRAPCDVVVVPSTWTEGQDHGRVVAGIKEQSRVGQLLGTAFAEASARGAALTLVTAWEMADPYLDHIEPRVHADHWEETGRAAIDELTSDWRALYPDVPVDVRVVHGRAIQVLHDLSRDCDLLVVARHRHSAHAHGHLGGVAYALLQATEVPMLVAAPVDVPGDATSRFTLEDAGHLLRCRSRDRQRSAPGPGSRSRSWRRLLWSAARAPWP